MWKITSGPAAFSCVASVIASSDMTKQFVHARAEKCGRLVHNNFSK